MDRIEKIARTLCAHDFGRLCDNFGHDTTGCMVGRGEMPHWSNCKATVDQLHLGARYMDSARQIAQLDGENS